MTRPNFNRWRTYGVPIESYPRWLDRWIGALFVLAFVAGLVAVRLL